MDCARCSNDPCTCEQSKAAGQPYYYKPCATPGCSVMIGTRLGTAIYKALSCGTTEPSQCRWCRVGVSHALRPK